MIDMNTIHLDMPIQGTVAEDLLREKAREASVCHTTEMDRVMIDAICEHLGYTPDLEEIKQYCTIGHYPNGTQLLMWDDEKLLLIYPAHVTEGIERPKHHLTINRAYINLL